MVRGTAAQRAEEGRQYLTDWCFVQIEINIVHLLVIGELRQPVRHRVRPCIIITYSFGLGTIASRYLKITSDRHIHIGYCVRIDLTFGDSDFFEPLHAELSIIIFCSVINFT